MKVEYELQVSGVGYPIEYVREGISDTLMLYAGSYGLAVMAIKAALSHGYPISKIKTYFELYNRGVELVFLKEAYINTETYKHSLKDKIELTGFDEDEIFKGLNNYFRRLAEKQILIAFEQAQKEVDDLHQRTKEGIETARINGKQIGRKAGTKLTTKKSIKAKDEIRKHSKDFDGTLNDIDCMKLVGVNRNTYYKYKREMKIS